MIIQFLLKLISSFEWFLQPAAAYFSYNMFEEGEKCGKFVFSPFFWVTGCYVRGIEADATHMCHSQNGNFWSLRIERNLQKTFTALKCCYRPGANTLLGNPRLHPPSLCTCCVLLFDCCYSLKWFPRIVFGAQKIDVNKQLARAKKYPNVV